MILKRPTDLTLAGQQGFTIVELMIALSVLSTILVISSTVMISLGSIYIKGINQSNTQNVARNLLNELVGQLQLGSAVPNISGTIISPGIKAVCLGNQRYTYRLKYKLDGTDSKSHVLWRDSLKNSIICVPINITNAHPVDSYYDSSIPGTELMPANMRLTEFHTTGNVDGTYTVSVTVAYGGDGTGLPTDLVQVSADGKTRCLSGQGSQYCAVSSLSQVVANRGVN